MAELNINGVVSVWRQHSEMTAWCKQLVENKPPVSASPDIELQK